MKIVYHDTKSKGLGDTIAKITAATGIKKVVDTIAEATGTDCGCSARQEKLNDIFTYETKK
jgi:glycerol dehydrogenase-like iron-containing ADH family enzyme